MQHQNINDVWVGLALIAADLLALAQSTLLTDQSKLHRAESKTLRYRLLHTPPPASPADSAGVPAPGRALPWALALARAFQRLQQIPLPA